MNLIEKVVCIVSLVYVMALVTYPWLYPNHSIYLLAYWSGLVLAVLCLIITLRDFGKRDFRTRNIKRVWLAALLLGGTFGWLLYLYFHGFRPRSSDVTNETEQKIDT